MTTLYDRSGRAIIRLYENWFVAYSEALHLGWLPGNAVYNQSGQCIGWFVNGIHRDRNGRIVAKDTGSVLPGMAGIPGKPGRPGLGGIPGMPGFSPSWSEMGFKEFFGV